MIGNLSVADVDAGDSVTFSITGGSGANVFTIENNELKVTDNAVLDFETEPSFALDITATDSGGLSTTQIFTINLLDLAEGDVITGTPGDDTLNGTDTDDIINGLAGNDVITAGAGNDLINGGRGADRINGGEGIDTVDYSSSSSNVIILLTTFFFRPSGLGFGGDARGDRLINVENIIGSDFSDILFGNREQNILEGGAGNDYLIGSGGRDQFIFKQGFGKDTVLDFNTSTNNFETLSFEYEGIESFNDLTPFISPIGFFQSSTRIDFGNGDRLTLLGVNAADLSEQNFEFI